MAECTDILRIMTNRRSQPRRMLTIFYNRSYIRRTWAIFHFFSYSRSKEEISDLLMDYRVKAALMDACDLRSSYRWELGSVPLLYVG